MTSGINSFNERLLGDMFSKYKEEASGSGSNIELEIRFKDITRDVFEALYTELYKSDEFVNPTLECSVNIISENVYERNSGKSDDTQYIRKLIFKGSNVIGDTYMTKSRILRNVHISDYTKYSVGLSKETESKKFSTNANAMVRFKIRVSFDYVPSKQGAKWRFDLTAVKRGVLSELGTSLKTIKRELFTDALGVDNFIEELPNDMIDSYEVEIENIDPTHSVTLDDMHIVKKVFGMINPSYLAEIAYQEEIYHIAEYYVNSHILNLFKNSTHRLKQLGNQVIALSKNTYYSDIFPPVGMYVTIKADGVRDIISINGNRCRIVKSDSMLEFIQGDVYIPGEVSILDAELITNDKLLTKNIKLDPTKYLLRIFDAMVFRDENISKTGFTNRLKFLEPGAELVSKFVIPSGNRTTPAKYRRLDEDLETGFREIWDADREEPVDGLIITEPDEPYLTTKNYKWKPYSHNTIDFLAMKCPQKLLGIKPYEVRPGYDLYLLFVGINHTMREKLGLGFIPHYRSMFPIDNENYYPIQFSSSANPLAYLYWHKTEDKSMIIDRQIVELSRNEQNTEWVFHRVRTDRKMEKNYFGNDFKTAELTYLNYIDPFSLEDLWSQSKSYFTKTADNIYTASNKYKRFVISSLLRDNLSGSKWVIDEAAGRGADLHRYQEIGVENALFIDIDPTAITELIARKFSYFAAKKRHVKSWFKTGAGDESGENNALKTVRTVTGYDRVHDIEYDKLVIKDVKSLTIHTLVADLKTPYKDLVANTFQFGINLGLIDGIVCNFALHYLCDDLNNLRNVLLFNSRMLKIGGLFIFTVMDGKAVHELLRPVKINQQWEARENNVLKYAIRKLYAGDKLTPVGQKVSVLLPFSDEMYEEPLCNVDTVITEAAKLGFEVELNASMDKFADKFLRADKALSDRLTPDDKKYVALHRFCSLRKIREPKKMD